jgi:hypothetical protein
MNSIQVYLAGAVWDTDDYGGWREGVISEWDDPKIDWYDPVERVEYDPKRHEPERVVAGDKDAICRSDAILVGLTDHRTVGTWREVEYTLMMNWIVGLSKDMIGALPPELDGCLGVYGSQKPIVIWTGLENAPEGRKSPWVEEAAPQFANMETCIDYIVSEVEDE